MRTAFQLLAIGALIATSLWILRPFMVALIWATTVAIATWPVLLRVQSWLGGRRGVAVAVLTTVLLLILVVPLYFTVTTIAQNVDQVAGWSKSLTTLIPSHPPGWVEAFPLIGSRLASLWSQMAATGPADLSERILPFTRSIALWFLSQVGNVGLLLLQFVLTLIITAILYANGEMAASGVKRFALRLAGAQGEKAVELAAQAVGGVAVGIVLTAIIQSALAGIGLAVAGVPFAMLLTAVMFILAVAQIGPSPVLIPAVIWVFLRSGAAWGTVFLVWESFSTVIDNFLRPVLIKRGGADLPLLLIFAGVIGGLVAFGLIGLFIGPVVLAVAYALLADWVSDGGPSA